MHTDQIVRWLADKPVKPEWKFRVAALMNASILNDRLSPEAAFHYWQSRRPEWFYDESTVVELERGSEAPAKAATTFETDEINRRRLLGQPEQRETIDKLRDRLLALCEQAEQIKDRPRRENK